uniref:Uncharacterized protein n=1 Tax=Oryza brachyantha TaxID=4533 RepID=J3MRE4_ORYBR
MGAIYRLPCHQLVMKALHFNIAEGGCLRKKSGKTANHQDRLPPASGLHHLSHARSPVAFGRSLMVSRKSPMAVGQSHQPLPISDRRTDMAKVEPDPALPLSRHCSPSCQTPCLVTVDAGHDLVRELPKEMKEEETLHRHLCCRVVSGSRLQRRSTKCKEHFKKRKQNPTKKPGYLPVLRVKTSTDS